MPHFRKRRFPKRRANEKRIEFQAPEAQLNRGSTGAESAYLRSSIDSHATVTVVLNTGERMRGKIRYYDRDCFSLGIAPRGPNLFIRKENVRCIIEE